MDLGNRGDGKIKKRESSTLYVCPMHPGQRSDEPGRCGICHMFLEPVLAVDLSPESWFYCPEHPEPQYVEPGKCPACGKELQKSDD